MALTKAEVDRLAREAKTDLERLKHDYLPKLRTVRKRLSAALKTAEAKDVIEASMHFGPNLGRWVGDELIANHKGAMAAMDIKALNRIGQGIASWYAVDAFGTTLAGPAWARGQVSDADVVAWAKSPDLWWRRLALVATTSLNSKTRAGAKVGDAPRTLAIVRLTMDDREDMVVKAVSWALRSLATFEPKIVAAFVDEHEDHLAARAKRETRTKLRTGVKTPAQRLRRLKSAAEH